MQLHHAWASGSLLTSLDSMSGMGETTSVTIDTRIILAVENITVAAGSYTDCLKILVSNNDSKVGLDAVNRIDWYCPDGIGLVKRYLGSEGATSGASTPNKGYALELSDIILL